MSEPNDAHSRKTIAEPSRGFLSWPARIALGLAILAAVPATIGVIFDHQANVARQSARAEAQRQEQQQHATDEARAAQEQQRQSVAHDLAQKQEQQRRLDAEAKAQQAQKAEEARKLAEREQAIRPARDALVQYGMAKVDLDAATQYRKSEEELADSTAKGMGASGNIDFSKLNKATGEATKALDQEDLFRQDCIKCLDKLKTFNHQILTAAAQDLIHDSSVDFHVREAVEGIMR